MPDEAECLENQYGDKKKYTDGNHVSGTLDTRHVILYIYCFMLY